MKLPGLRRYLVQSLGYEVERVESFRGLVGTQVISSPVFRENVLCFGVCYGLVLQGLAKSGIYTNLLPKEILKDRLVKQKKPWAVAAVASLLLGCGISFGAYCLAMGTVDTGLWKQAADQANQITQRSARLRSEADSAIAKVKATDQIGQHLVGNVEGRIRWLELIKAINQCLPRDDYTSELAGKKPVSRDMSAQISESKVLHIKNFECQYCEDLSTWFSSVKQQPWYQDPYAAEAGGGSVANGGAEPSAPTTGTPGATAPSGSEGQAGEQANLRGPKGPGWIVKLEGFHYHNKETTVSNFGAQYVRNTLIDRLLNGKVELPNVDGQMETVTMRELGISYPVLVDPKRVEDDSVNIDAAMADMGGSRRSASAGVGRDYSMPRMSPQEDNVITLQRFSFVVHFCWQPKTPSQRRQAKEEATKAQQASGGEQASAQQ